MAGDRLMNDIERVYGLAVKLVEITDDFRDTIPFCATEILEHWREIQDVMLQISKITSPFLVSVEPPNSMKVFEGKTYALVDKLSLSLLDSGFLDQLEGQEVSIIADGK